MNGFWFASQESILKLVCPLFHVRPPLRDILSKLTSCVVASQTSLMPCSAQTSTAEPGECNAEIDLSGSAPQPGPNGPKDYILQITEYTLI